MIEKIKKVLKDLVDVKKYKKQKNTFENKYNSRNEEYIELLETIPMLCKKLDNYETQIKDLKAERKELKRIIEEDMTPKKRKK